MDCKILDSKFYEKLLAIKDPSIKVSETNIFLEKLTKKALIGNKSEHQSQK